MAARIPNPGTGWRSVVNFTPQPYTLGKEPTFLLYRSLSGPRAGLDVARKDSCTYRDANLGESSPWPSHYRLLAALFQLFWSQEEIHDIGIVLR